MFVIKFIYTVGGRHEEYYLGGSYKYDRGRYACIGERDMAKTYKSIKAAVNTINRFSEETLVNYPEGFEVEEI